MAIGQCLVNRLATVSLAQCFFFIGSRDGAPQAGNIGKPGEVPLQWLEIMQRKVVEDLPVDAKLIFHQRLLRSKVFRARNFFNCNKASVQEWVTLRRKEGTHEKTIPYPERCAFSKYHRTFARGLGQPPGHGKECIWQNPGCGRGTPASTHQSSTEAGR